MPDAFNTTLDAFLNGRIRAKQPARGFRSGLDAVFLAAACPARPGQRILEAGCGAGIAALCLCARVPGAHATGIEMDSQLAGLARENADANDLGARFEVIVADLTAPWPELSAAGVRREAYDHVIANPPFYTRGQTRPSRDERRDRACAMDKGQLEEWLRLLATVAKPGGTCTVIHTAQALPELLRAFEGRFGGLHVAPIYPKAGANAIRVIVSGRKGSRASLSLGAGIVAHNADGTPTEAAQRILRDGSSLPL